MERKSDQEKELQQYLKQLIGLNNRSLSQRGMKVKHRYSLLLKITVRISARMVITVILELMALPSLKELRGMVDGKEVLLRTSPYSNQLH
jgi:hypothetical protein